LIPVALKYKHILFLDGPGEYPVPILFEAFTGFGNHLHRNH
jgi:hypothetical protein